MPDEPTSSLGGLSRRQPLLIAVDEEREALANLETQLVQRYARDYRVECLADPDEAVRTLKGLAQGGDEVALVLAAAAFSRGSGSHLLEQVRQLHSHAKRRSSSTVRRPDGSPHNVRHWQVRHL